MLDPDPQARDINQPQASDHQPITQQNPILVAEVEVEWTKVAPDHPQEDTLEMVLHSDHHINLPISIDHQTNKIYSYILDHTL